jgi:hypothetical protein
MPKNTQLPRVQLTGSVFKKDEDHEALVDAVCEKFKRNLDAVAATHDQRINPDSPDGTAFCGAMVLNII